MYLKNQKCICIHSTTRRFYYKSKQVLKKIPQNSFNVVNGFVFGHREIAVAEDHSREFPVFRLAEQAQDALVLGFGNADLIPHAK